MVHDKDVTVLGAGLIGICTALSLTERGQSVRLIDRGTPGQETSAGNAGIISPWSIVPQSMPGTWKQIPSLMFGRHRPLSVRKGTWPGMIPWGLSFLSNGRRDRIEKISAEMRHLCSPSIDLYTRHLTGTGGEDLIRDSYYVHAYRNGEAANPDALEYSLRREAGAEVERIGAEDLADLEPALAPIFAAAILIKGQARALSPGRIGEVLAEKFRALGGEIVRDDISHLQWIDDHWSIRCAHDTYQCKKVIVALGAWSAELLKRLGIRMPLMAERGYHVEFSAPGITLNHSVMDVASKVVASSMNDGLRIAGQAEFAHVDAPPDPAKKAQLTAIATEVLSDLDTSESRFWMGRRPSLPDSLPVIGEFPGLPGLFCNFGHSHYGLMMAPKSGELAADLVIGHTPNRDVTAISPARFV